MFETTILRFNWIFYLLESGKSTDQIHVLTYWPEYEIDTIELVFNLTKGSPALKKRTWQQLRLILFRFFFPMILIGILWYMVQ